MYISDTFDLPKLINMYEIKKISEHGHFKIIVTKGLSSCTATFCTKTNDMNWLKKRARSLDRYLNRC